MKRQSFASHKATGIAGIYMSIAMHQRFRGNRRGLFEESGSLPLVGHPTQRDFQKYLQNNDSL